MGSGALRREVAKLATPVRVAAHIVPLAQAVNHVDELLHGEFHHAQKERQTPIFGGQAALGHVERDRSKLNDQGLQTRRRNPNTDKNFVPKHAPKHIHWSRKQQRIMCVSVS